MFPKFNRKPRRRKSNLRHQVSRQSELAEERVLLSAAPIDGTGNNIENPDWGSTGETFLRLAPTDYSDGISEVGGEDRPSAREISNAISDSGGEDIISQRLLSAMIYAWGQFVDHDITQTIGGSGETTSIAVPTGDPWFDPSGSGTQTIDTMRSGYDPATGTDASNPRQQVNNITAFLDGSMVYGSTEETAAALRTFQGGLLKTSDGNLLPRNDAATFPEGTLAMDNENPFVSGDHLFAAGDSRANENVELTSLHTLFVREHNLQAGRIAAEHPDYSDEEIYQAARSVVIAEIQAITYNEWLPSLLGRGALDRYQGYDPTVNPGISNEFATAAFRFGHSQLGDDVEFLDDDGLEAHDEVALSEAFFNPDLLSETGIDSILKYLSADPSSEVDPIVVDSVRNFLFGPPGAGGLDLASLNIQRGRDHGLADYNTTRESFGLPRVTSFAEITSDPELQSGLESLYGTVDNIDLWVGGLAEDHLPGSSLGETFQTIIVDQFERLRDGDRFWYQNQFSGRELAQLERTSLSDIIERNTELTSIQRNAFVFRAEISGAVSVDQNRNGRPDRRERPAAGAEVRLINTDDGSVVATAVTDRAGRFSFGVADGLRTGVYQITVTDAAGETLAASRDVAVTGGDDFEHVRLSVPATRPAPTQAAPPRRDSTGRQMPTGTPSGNSRSAERNRQQTAAVRSGLPSRQRRSANAASSGRPQQTSMTSTPAADTTQNAAGDRGSMLDLMFQQLSVVGLNDLEQSPVRGRHGR
ncbi:MAG: peroxidase [Planctomycetaceae bacterium]|nr:peroxidase [Planctomycetaceae bacterium]